MTSGDDVSFLASSSDSEDEIDHMHRKAKEALDKAKLKAHPIFAIRSNIAFNAELLAPEDVPLPGQVVTFGVRDFIHVKERFNQDWWIGRLVRIGSNLGFIPSPAKIDSIRLALYNNSSSILAASLAAATAAAANTNAGGANNGENGDNRDSVLPSAGGMFNSFEDANDNPTMNLAERPLVVNSAKKTSSVSGPIQNLAASRRLVPEMDDETAPNAEDNENFDPSNAGLNSTGGSMGGQKNKTGIAVGSTAPNVTKRKPFAKKLNLNPPYEIVPCMRPVVFLGPALKGFEVTDMMQKAIFDYLRKQFEGRLILTRINTDLSQLKRLASSNPQSSSSDPVPVVIMGPGISSSGIVGQSSGIPVGTTTGNSNSNGAVTGAPILYNTGGIKKSQNATMLQIQAEIERIFELSQHMQLLVLDVDTVNHPSQIAKTCLAPLLVYIKIVSLKVLSRLIKNRGKSQKHNASFQLSAAEKLQQCVDESFDLILDQNNLASASEVLRHFLDTYLTATHPPQQLSKVGRILGCREPSLRKLSKSDPNYGISVILQPGLQAGFTAREMLSLVGSAMSWAGSSVAVMAAAADNAAAAAAAATDIGDGGSPQQQLNAQSVFFPSEPGGLVWGGDPEEYRSDREMRVDQRDRTSSTSNNSGRPGQPGGSGPGASGGPCGVAGDDALTPLLKPVHPDIFLSKLSLKSQLLTHTATSNHMAPMSNHDSEPAKIYTSRSVLQQKQRLAELEQKKRSERDLARQRRKQVRLNMVQETGPVNPASGN